MCICGCASMYIYIYIYIIAIYIDTRVCVRGSKACSGRWKTVAALLGDCIYIFIYIYIYIYIYKRQLYIEHIERVRVCTRQ